MTRVLVADDDDTLRLVASRQLKRLGFEVQSAANGLQAVEKYRDFQPNLVLMDIHMPEMDGIEAAKIMREAEDENAAAKLIIIAMTASQLKQVVLEAGLDDYLFKPFLFEELREMVGKWVKLPEVETG